MPDIKTQTMCAAIETIAEKIRIMRELLETEGDDPDLEQMLEDYIRAAEDLKRAYDKTAKLVRDLPPYRELVDDLPD